VAEAVVPVDALVEELSASSEAAAVCAVIPVDIAETVVGVASICPDLFESDEQEERNAAVPMIKINPGMTIRAMGRAIGRVTGNAMGRATLLLLMDFSPPVCFDYLHFFDYFSPDWVIISFIVLYAKGRRLEAILKKQLTLKS
jgi:hypothetical protein